MRGDSSVWEFILDEDEMVVPAGPPGTTENLRLAFETFIIPFGTNPGLARIYLRAWRKSWEDEGAGYVLGTAAASARRLDADFVELGDFYKQFESCTTTVVTFEAGLKDLIEFLEDKFPHSSELDLGY